MDEQDQYQSEFNAAIATLMRIDSIKKGLTLATIERDYEKKFIFLEAYYLELVSIMKGKDEDDMRKKYEQIRENYYIYKEAFKKGKRTINKSIIDSFMDWEIELKNLEQKYGMNIKTKGDPRYALAARG